jgi:SAM-dependent methyltransferase
MVSMKRSVYKLHNFYLSKLGRLVRRTLLQRIFKMWPDLKGLRVMGCGYALPYMSAIKERGAERVFVIMSASQGGYSRMAEGENIVAFSDDTELPLETESVDRILMVHALEHTLFPDSYMRELWRVLKSNGRLIMVVPNRLGLWARVDWTPFGHGRPWSMGQINNVLEENFFILEESDRALFMPPFRSSVMQRSAYLLESLGRAIIPGMAGVYIVEASKQIYAMRGQTARQSMRQKNIIAPERVGVLSRQK